MLIAIIFLHFLYSVSYLEGGALCHGSTLIDLLQKSDRFTEKILFLEIYDFGTKINKTGADLNLRYYVFGTKN